MDILSRCQNKNNDFGLIVSLQQNIERTYSGETKKVYGFNYQLVNIFFCCDIIDFPSDNDEAWCC